MQPDAGVQPGHERDEPQHHGEIEEKLLVAVPQAERGERDQIGDGEAEHGQLWPAPSRDCGWERDGMHRGGERDARQPSRPRNHRLRSSYRAKIDCHSDHVGTVRCAWRHG